MGFSLVLLVIAGLGFALFVAVAAAPRHHHL